jgi:allantoicase
MTDFTELPDLAAERLGGAVLLANDEFFAPKENLLTAAEPVWRAGVYTERGKWMDGWETRRRRTPGHDWCIVRLGMPAVVHGVVVDTTHFRGNHPEQCSIEACAAAQDADPGVLATGNLAAWTEILPRSALREDAGNRFPVGHRGRVTHLRLNIHPDGGVARLRVYGEPQPPSWLRSGVTADLAAITHGGLVVASSDMSFGHRHNLTLPGSSLHMGDGWETRRRRGPGHDWVVVRLAARGALERIEVDTDHFKGNAPEGCSVEARDLPPGAPAELSGTESGWTPLLARTALRPDHRHAFDIPPSPPVTHVRLAIYPDGGIARLRLIGTVA